MRNNIEPAPETLAVRAGIALAELLVRQFEEIALELHFPGAPECPCQKGALCAKEILGLCDSLIEELRRYERYEMICQRIEDDGEQHPLL